MIVNLVKLKASARTAVLACAFAVFSCAASFAQAAPKPQPPVAGQAPDKAEGVMDPDKKVVQDRWGYSTGEPATKVEKKRGHEKPKPANGKQ